MRSRTLVAALLFGALAAPASAYADCPGADLVPSEDNLGEVRDALLCLHNEARAARDLPPLRESVRLRRAATSHSGDMVEDGFFGHTGRRGSTFIERILDADYARASDDWVLGENLAWAAGELSSAQAVMAAWMDSPGQRSTILRRSYRDVGFGIRLGMPQDDAVGATFTANFGARD